MNANDILCELLAEGTALRLTPDKTNLVAPAGRLTPSQRERIKTNKPELIAFLVAAHATTTELIAAAMKRCDEFNDSEAAREQMRRDCLELSPELQADLLEHFRGKPQGETNDEF